MSFPFDRSPNDLSAAEVHPIDKHLHEVACKIVCPMACPDEAGVTKHGPVSALQVFGFHHGIKVERGNERPGVHLLERDGQAAVLETMRGAVPLVDALDGDHRFAHATACRCFARTASEAAKQIAK